MQRRAAAIYFVFFLAIAVGAWAYVGVAEDAHQPEFSLSGERFANGTTATIDGVEYAASDISPGSGGSLEATLSWTNQSAVQTATLEHNATVSYADGEYTVDVPNETDPASFTLRESHNVSALLAADDGVEDQIAEQNGTSYVVHVPNRTLEPLAEWLPEPATEQFAEGDAFPYQNATTTVAAVDAGSVSLRWRAPADREADLTEGGNVTLANGERYFAHFTGDGAVVLTHGSEYPAYSQTVAERDYFAERLAGLWGVVIIAGGAALLLLSVAYLPSRG